MSIAWFHDFLRDELATYPGRAKIVARMVVAATVFAVLSMIFRIPLAYQGAIYALLVSHNAPEDNWRSAFRVVAGTVLTTVYILAGACLFVGSPPLHFFWNIASFSLAFFCISAMREYAAAVPVAVVIGTAIILWDRPLPAGTNVADTLWLCLSSTTAAIVTAAVSSLFAAFEPHGSIVRPLRDRLQMVEEALTSCATGTSLTAELTSQLDDAVLAGTSAWRLSLRRSGAYRSDQNRLAAVGALVGGLVDIAATLQLVLPLPASERLIASRLAATIADFRTALLSAQKFIVTRPEPSPGDSAPLRQIADTLELMAIAWAEPENRLVNQLESIRLESAIFVPDAFINPEHLKFALRGCLASTLCYLVYNAIAWHGLSSSIPTCMFTALSTVGASRQKQLVRLTGAILGCVIGIGAQVYIFPSLDSIQGFALVFAAVSLVSAWFMTCTPRLSYLGLQVAVAFDLIHLQSFRLETSLSAARDRVVGVSMGLIAMWLAFDYLWSSEAGVMMKRSFVRSLRLLARFVRAPAMPQGEALRETVHSALDQAHSYSDGVLFEFGPNRASALEFREEVRRWQPQLRFLFIMRVSALKFELPAKAVRAQTLFDDCSAGTLEDLANEIESGKERHSSLPDCLTTLQRDISDLSHFAVLRAMDKQLTSLAAAIDVACGK